MSGGRGGEAAGDPPTAAAKAALRREAAARRDAIPREERARLSAAVHDRLRATAAWRAAEVVGVYVAKGSEVETMPLIAKALGAKEVVAAPVTDVETGRIHFREVDALAALRPGAFGVLEPQGSPLVLAHQFDLVLVPGLAFDGAGHRVGYGKGYYDRYLAHLECPAFGLAYAAQLVEGVPRDAHDVPVDAVVTEAAVHRAGGGRGAGAGSAGGR